MSRKKVGFGGNTKQTMDAAGNAAATLTKSQKSIFLGSTNVTLVGMDSIEIDPNNPRKLLIQDKIIGGLNINNKLYETSKKEIKDKTTIEELNKLENLSESIKKNGLLNAIVIYKKDENFVIAAGERRFLACTLLGYESIPAKILPKKPSELQLRQIQWEENFNREDLAIKDKLNNIRQIIKASEENIEKVSIRKLAELINTTKTHAARFLSILREQPGSELSMALEKNKIKSLKTAELISSVKNEVIKSKLIEMAINGDSVETLKNRMPLLKFKGISDAKNLEKINISIYKDELSNFLKYMQKNASSYLGNIFNEKINWSDNRQIKKEFKKIISQIGETHANE